MILKKITKKALNAGG